MKNIFTVFFSAGALFLMGCAATPYQNQRWPASVADKLNVKLTDIVSVNSGYWDVKKDKETYYGRYKAFIVSGEEDSNVLYVFAETDGLKQAPIVNADDAKKPAKIEKQNDDSKFTLIAENNKFIWGSDWAGTEPSLAVNGRGSLVIKTNNEGIGRSAWNQEVIARLNPSNNVLEVIGFEYNSRDKIDLSSNKCSYNFNTGVGIIVSSGPEVDRNDKPIKPVIKSKRVKVSTAKVNINDWKESYEMSVLKDCMN